MKNQSQHLFVVKLLLYHIYEVTYMHGGMQEAIAGKKQTVEIME